MRKIIENIDFGNEAGDDMNPDDLMNCFVEQRLFRSFLDSKNKILLATAKKGVGKSALVKWIEFKLKNKEDPPLTIFCRGKDLSRNNFQELKEPSNPNEYIKDWMARLCTTINRRIGSELKIALDGDKMALVEMAEIDGFKGRNIVSALVDRLTRISKERGRIPPANQEEILKRLLKREVWILVDDLDATYQRTADENLEMSTFFSACRYLTSEINGVIIRTTMRTDVWPMIRRFDEALDKMDQYQKEIVWNQSDFRKLLYRRIKAQIDLLSIPLPPKPQVATDEEEQEYFINQVFSKRTSWGEYDKRTYKVLYTLSYHRPRWAIQLCKLAQEEALQDSNSTLIDRTHIDSIWGKYGNKRIADLVAEHKHQTKDMEELIVAFRGAPRRMSRQELLDWIKNKITNHMTPVIENKDVKAPLPLAHFLFRVGFIVARVESEESDYEHYHFSEMPDFLSTRTNQDFKAIWEIHPCYREALDIQKMNRYQRKNRNHAR